MNPQQRAIAFRVHPFECLHSAHGIYKEEAPFVLVFRDCITTETHVLDLESKINESGCFEKRKCKIVDDLFCESQNNNQLKSEIVAYKNQNVAPNGSPAPIKLKVVVEREKEREERRKEERKEGRKRKKDRKKK